MGPPSATTTRFSTATRAWFDSTFASPTAAQLGAWQAISHGRHTLVVAPTGSGKTLAAFLWALDRLSTTPARDPQARCRVIYVSPLKALAVDVERNLRAPLSGIGHSADRLGLPTPDIRVGMRTGDTPADQRRAFTRTPPDILITTPESLFLLLTSAAREALRGVETIIVDEIHAMAATKRGAHLALSLERLDALAERPAQRIGLSATVRPVDEVATFLAGPAPVEIVQPGAAKTIELAVEVPVADLTRLDAEPADTPAEPGGATRRASIWPAVERRVFDLIGAHRSTIVFANSRRLAERLCARLNELAAAQQPPDGGVPDGGVPDGGVPDGRAPRGRAPGEKMAQSPTATGAAPVIARAHHGSVSREERKQIEEGLKSGQLPCVVATSSLELGIDMGAVDLVIQVAAPPSVAAGLQRVGRAGHQVGAASHGVVFPQHRGDLLSCAVIAERMRAGAIEALRYPRNPLDVLAQQIVAMVALEPWSVTDLATVIRRAAPFAELPDSALDATLDMLSGRYPSTAFAELRPRLLWDRDTGVLRARPGAQRLAVTSGGTIPDRGLFGVFLASGAEDGSGSAAPRRSRVGELDEEMVYESRVGDVFLLGSTSWRIEEITPDRVLVSPAPGAPARMPFWKGDQPARPVELGRAIGAGLRDVSRLDPAAATARLAGAGLDRWAIDNLLSYLADQRAATGHLPDDRTIVVERFRDELGDWRLTIHCVLGAKINGAWALAISARLTQRYGLDAQVLPSDDGIVVRLPDMLGGAADGDHGADGDVGLGLGFGLGGVDRGEPVPGAELVVFDPDEVAGLVEESVGTSAMFAARFRECAARALLLPRRDPRRRQPLWQQRQRAAQLLDVAREFTDFPITLEAARECLQDVLDVPSLVTLMRALAGRTVRLIEVETTQPSPFARSLLFGYVGAFLYGGDTPLAERRAAALALDSTLLGELLGRVELRELLDPGVLAETERRLQWLDGSRRLRDAEDAAELLRVLGDLSEQQAAERGVRPEWLAELAHARRAMTVRIAGEARWLAVEDASRVRDALGTALPVGLAEAYLRPVADPLGDLISRYARSHTAFTTEAVAARFGLGTAVVAQTLRRLAASGQITAGEFTPTAIGPQWCDSEILRLLRRRSLAALRREIEPAPARALASFLPRWQQVGGRSTGVSGLAAVLEQLQGVLIPASAWERLVLPARVPDYSPAQLDQVCASGEVLWAGHGAIGAHDGWICFAWADSAPLLLPEPTELHGTTLGGTELHEAVLAALRGGQALFFRQLADLGPADEVLTALWDLVWAGRVANDTLAPVRGLLAPGGAHRSRPTAPRSRYHRPSRASARALAVARAGPPSAGGRWYALPEPDPNPTRRRAALAESLIERHGVLTRGAVAAELVSGGFAAVYPVLGALEERGAARRGYFIEALGAAQFAVPGAVDRLRARAERYQPDSAADRDVGRGDVWVLAATDPANPFGAALPWPERTVDDAGGTGHRPGRKPGALVVIVDGELAIYVERGGRTLLSFATGPEVLGAAAGALAGAVRGGALGALTVRRADGGDIQASPLRDALIAAGFRATPGGLRLRP